VRGPTRPWSTRWASRSARPHAACRSHARNALGHAGICSASSPTRGTEGACSKSPRRPAGADAMRRVVGDRSRRCPTCRRSSLATAQLDLLPGAGRAALARACRQHEVIGEAGPAPSSRYAGDMRRNGTTARLRVPSRARRARVRPRSRTGGSPPATTMAAAGCLISSAGHRPTTSGTAPCRRPRGGTGRPRAQRRQRARPRRDAAQCAVGGHCPRHRSDAARTLGAPPPRQRNLFTRRLYTAASRPSTRSASAMPSSAAVDHYVADFGSCSPKPPATAATAGRQPVPDVGHGHLHHAGHASGRFD
jgi:hypothetical protein